MLLIESNSRAIAELLDGEAERRASGFDATTATRTLFVPYTLTRDAAIALAICKAHGLLLEKLDAMTPAAADVLFATTIAGPMPEN
jgi:hypothetical protein